jgi:hypothetical protein
MSAAADHVAEARRLRDTNGWGARRIAAHLGITRYAADRLLSQAPATQPPADQVAEVADQPPAEVADRLTDRPEYAADLAFLAEGTGTSPDRVADYAVACLAEVYRQALATGRLRPGQPLRITHINLQPGLPSATPAAVPAAGR